MNDTKTSGKPGAKATSAKTIQLTPVASGAYTLKAKDGYAGAAILIPGTPPSGDGGWLVVSYYVSSTVGPLSLTLPNSVGMYLADLPDGFATKFSDLAAVVNSKFEPDPTTGVGNGGKT